MFGRDHKPDMLTLPATGIESRGLGCVQRTVLHPSRDQHSQNEWNVDPPPQKTHTQTPFSLDLASQPKLVFIAHLTPIVQWICGPLGRMLEQVLLTSLLPLK